MEWHLAVCSFQVLKQKFFNWFTSYFSRRDRHLDRQIVSLTQIWTYLSLLIRECGSKCAWNAGKLPFKTQDFRKTAFHLFIVTISKNVSNWVRCNQQKDKSCQRKNQSEHSLKNYILFLMTNTFSEKMQKFLVHNLRVTSLAGFLPFNNILLH